MNAATAERLEANRSRPLGLVGLIAILGVVGLALYRVGGLPHLPGRLPSALEVTVTLQGSDVPLAAFGYVFTTAAWLVWLWIVATLVAQVGVQMAGRFGGETPSLLRLRRTVDSVTLPLVRRAVEGAFGALLLATVVSQAAPIAAAQTAPAPIAAVTKQAESPTTKPAEPPEAIDYIVQPGDNLWSIAQRFYGTGVEYRRLVDANTGRAMSDGRKFGPDGVIHGGWVLHVPLPSTSVQQHDGLTFYTVESGDSLSGIAARLLGDEGRWQDIFQLNAGKASVDARTLTDPNLIWPGLELQLPVAPPTPPTAAVPPSPPVVVEPPAPVQSQSAGATLDQPSPVASAEPRSTPAQAAQPAAGGASGLPLVSIGGAMGAAALATSVALGRRRFRRSLSEPPPADEPDMPLSDGFAEADAGRTLRRHIAGAGIDPIQALAELAQLYLQEQGLRDARIVAVRHGRASAAVTIGTAFLDQPRLVQLASDFGRRVACDVQAVITSDQDVLWQLASLKPVTLPAPPDRALQICPLLLPLGVLPNRQIIEGNWPELGHVLVAGLAGGGADVVATSLVSGLAARCRPDDLQLWTVGTDHGFPPGLQRFPHQAGPRVEPADEAGLAALFDQLEATLDERIAASSVDGEESSAERPTVLLLVEELADITSVSHRLDALALHGPRHGIRVIAASGSPHLLGREAAEPFATRMVLQTLDGDQSMQLLGQPDAAELRPGEVLLRLDGRRPVRARGFRLAPEYLDELAAMMNDAYGSRVDAQPQADLSQPADPVPLAPAATEEADEPPVATGTERRTAMQTMLPIGPARVEAVDVEPDAAPAPPRSDPADRPGRTRSLLKRLDELNVETPIELECFGPLRIVADDRDLTAEDGGANGKLWELMAFLGVRSNGVVSKDKLLGALWPDLEPDKAENALRQVRFRLRHHLTKELPQLSGDVIRSERDGTCRLNTELVNSDGERFWTLCKVIPSLNAEEAIGHYRVLADLFTADLLVDPCYEWVHEREDGGLSLQERAREEFRRLTKHVARLCQESGHPEQAVPLYRRLLQAEPTLEDIARELYRCYRQLGDRAALVREHRHLCQALQELLADPDDPDDSEVYDPDPETIRVYEEALAAVTQATAHVQVESA